MVGFTFISKFEILTFNILVTLFSLIVDIILKDFTENIIIILIFFIILKKLVLYLKANI